MRKIYSIPLLLLSIFIISNCEEPIVEDDSVDPGTILKEIQAGYMLGERLLRPSLVSVSKKKTPKETENKEKKDQK